MELQILVIDDEVLITNTLKRLIDSFVGCSVITSVDPVQALEMDELKEGRVDMIIADCMMPQMNGAEFLLKSRESCPNAVRILLTGSHDKNDVQKLINKVGLFNYVEKPWDNNDMIRIIKEGLETVRIAKEVERKNKELIIWNKTLEQRVKSRVAAIKNLLDNATEGFLTVKADLTVGDEYSKECVNIFEKEISQVKFSELIYSDNVEQREFVDDILNKVYKERSNLKADAFLSLMPSNVELGQKKLELSYKVVKDPDTKNEKAVMVVINDITERVELESSIDEERKRLKMVVGAVVDSRGFFENINSYKKFFSTNFEDIIKNKKTAKEALNSVFMKVHTFKGVFALKDMSTTAQNLHKFETELLALMDSSLELSKEDILNLFKRIKPSDWMEEDIMVLKDVLGKSFFLKADFVEVKSQSLEDIKEKLVNVKNLSQVKLIIEDIKKLRYINIKRLTKGYEEYVSKLTTKLEKSIDPFVVESENIDVDPYIYTDFIKSLGHIFRNAMNYGIEYAEQRLEAGKKEKGRLKFKIRKENDHLMFIIADDGKGIDIEKIKKKAIEQEMYTKEEISELPERNIIDLIFEPRFSTNDDVDNLSGRGVGLSAVKDEVNKLDGSIEVKTQKGLGTAFKIKIPMKV